MSEIGHINIFKNNDGTLRYEHLGDTSFIEVSGLLKDEIATNGQLQIGDDTYRLIGLRVEFMPDGTETYRHSYIAAKLPLRFAQIGIAIEAPFSPQVPED